MGRCQQPCHVIACEGGLATSEVQADRCKPGSDDHEGYFPRPVFQQRLSPEVIQQEHHPDEGQHLDFGQTSQQEEPQRRAILPRLATHQKLIVRHCRRKKTARKQQRARRRNPAYRFHRQGVRCEQQGQHKRRRIVLQQALTHSVHKRCIHRMQQQRNQVKRCRGIVAKHRVDQREQQGRQWLVHAHRRVGKHALDALPVERLDKRIFEHLAPVVNGREAILQRACVDADCQERGQSDALAVVHGPESYAGGAFLTRGDVNSIQCAALKAALGSLLPSPPDTKKPVLSHRLFRRSRRDRDSNPGGVAPNTLSRRAP